MPTLTALAPDPRQPGYRLVEVDRGRFASLPAEALQGLELTLGAVREVAYIVFDLPGLKVNQIAGQVHLWCVVAQSSKPQRCVLKAGAREIK